MALNAYLTLKGQTQGTIKGGVTQKGKEGTIAVDALTHDIVSPRDHATGLPTGKRVHKPLVITKELDRATPLLHIAMANNEVFTGFTLNFYEPNQAGIDKNFFRIELVHATIVDIATRMDNVIRPEFTKIQLYEEVSFVYQTITWTDLDNETSGSDSWQTT